MRKRIIKTERVDVNAVINDIEHRIDTKKQLVKITMKQENCGFGEAKSKIQDSVKWNCIKKEVKLLNN
jgi:hypothetical protein